MGDVSGTVRCVSCNLWEFCSEQDWFCLFTGRILKNAACFVMLYFLRDAGHPVRTATQEIAARMMQYQLLAATATGEILAMEPARRTCAA